MTSTTLRVLSQTDVPANSIAPSLTKYSTVTDPKSRLLKLILLHIYFIEKSTDLLKQLYATYHNQATYIFILISPLQLLHWQQVALEMPLTELKEVIELMTKYD